MGRVSDASTGNPLAGWTVQVFGLTNATTTTDANGQYVVTGLASDPNGPTTYVVCEVPQSGWQQVNPTDAAPCATGMGYAFPAIPGATISFLNFGNLAL